jgi:molybdopterin converting factor small subunit
MARLLLFGPARQAAGTDRAEIEGPTVAAVCEAAADRFGPRFADVLRSSALWVNGEPAGADAKVGAGDELAVVPPVSGGA